MSNHHCKSKKQDREETAFSKKTLRVSAVAAGVVLIVVLSASGLWRTKTEVGNMESASAPMLVSQTQKGPVQPALRFEILVGKWQRTDSDYSLDIKSVRANGKMDVVYLNPSVIHVAEAKASNEAGTLTVFIKLEDVNYPGATYTLSYDPSAEMLKGVYHQPLLQQSFQIAFRRSK